MALIRNEAGEIVDDATGEVVDERSLTAEQVASINQPPTPSQQATAMGAAPTKDIKERIKALAEQRQRGLSEQEQMLRAQQARIESLAGREQQVDLSPTLAYIDQIAGTQTARQYKAPQTRVAKEREIIELQNTLMAQKDRLTDNQERALEAEIKQRIAELKPTSAKLAQMEKPKTLPAAQAATLGEAESAYAAVDDATDIVNEGSKLLGPQRGVLSKIKGYFEFGESGVKAKELQAELKARSQMVGKFLEGGVLRKEDESKYERMLPQITDSPEVAKSKIETVKKLIARKNEENLKAFGRAGYDVSRFPKGGGLKSTQQQKSYTEMSVQELRELAKKRGLAK